MLYHKKDLMKQIKTNVYGFWNSSKTNKIVAISIAALVIVVGVTLSFTKATGFFAAIESEAGTTTTNAKVVSDPAASGGQAIQFTAPIVTPPPGGGSALTSRPNDGTGYWPDFSNTGYKNTPANAGGLGLSAYPGSLTDYMAGMSNTKYVDITFPDNSVISYKRFLMSKMSIHGNNLTFVGCLFEGKSPNDNLIQFYGGGTLTIRYSTFKPAAYATPPGNDGTITSSHTAPGTPFNQSWQYLTTMNSAIVNMDHNDIWGNAGMQMTTSQPNQPSVWTNNYIHDQADNDSSTFSGGGTNYHHDGIGPQSEGNGGPMIIDHNTIASIGNTNAVALQGNGVYDHVSVTNNYVSGWGYALSIGITNNATNITVTGNIFSGELKQLYGFLYGNLWGGTARGSTWRNNLFQVRSGDGNLSPTDHGKYSWPTDNSGHTTDYGG